MIEERIQHELHHWKVNQSKVERLWGWDTPAGRIRAKRRVDFYINEGGITAGKKVLEIGCGIGTFTKEVSKTGAELIACDLVPELLDRAKADVNALNVSFDIQDVHKTSYADNSFDVIYGSSVLHHLDIDKALAELYRILKKGGKIVFTEPNMLNPQIMIQKNIPFIKRALGDTPDETAFFKWGMKKRLKKSGYTNIKVKAHDFLHPLVPTFLISVINGIGSVVEKIPLLKEVAGSHLIVAEK